MRSSCNTISRCRSNEYNAIYPPVEVFKTNVKENDQANDLLQVLYSCFPDHEINFDLDDRDNILRVESPEHPVETEAIIKCLNHHGFQAEVLMD